LDYESWKEKIKLGCRYQELRREPVDFGAMRIWFCLWIKGKCNYHRCPLTTVKNRLRDYLNQNISGKEKEYIGDLASELDLPREIRKKAEEIYFLTKGTIARSESCTPYVVASLYLACKIHRKPFTLYELAEISGIRGKAIGRAQTRIKRELEKQERGMCFITTPIEFVPRFCEELQLSREVQSEAIWILRKAIDERITPGREPAPFAAAAVYIASILKGERKRQHDIWSVTGVTETTLRNTYKELVEHLNINL